MNPSVITYDQKKKFRAEYTDDNGDACVLVANVRYDDNCRNGHNSFAITGSLYDRTERIPGESYTVNADGKKLWLGSCGCIHEDIARRIPELEHYVKWHLVSSDGPMHYIADSMYYAKAIPKEQGQYFAYYREPMTGAKNLLEIVNEETKSKLDARHGGAMSYEPCYNSMAKEPNLEAARACAVWPDARLEDFTVMKLQARLPALMEDFQRDVEALGFIY
jgi:hypothetical protein